MKDRRALPAPIQSRPSPARGSSPAVRRASASGTPRRHWATLHACISEGAPPHHLPWPPGKMPGVACSLFHLRNQCPYRAVLLGEILGRHALYVGHGHRFNIAIARKQLAVVALKDFEGAEQIGAPGNR